jgi:LacI family repressor for deo operon, udp, cdd, tsx, nupC, and nupG
MNNTYKQQINKNTSEPIYLQIEKNIMESIKADGLIKGDRLPSEGDFASTFKVSRMTVRQAMGELEQKDIIHRIQGKGTFIKNLDPKAIAHSSSSARNNIGIYISSNTSRQHPFFLEFIEQIERQGGFMDLTVSITSDISQICNKDNFNGIILVSRAPLDVLLELEERKIPFVLTYEHFETYGREFPSVLFDSADSTYKLTEHLIKLGHKRIALFTGALKGELKGEGSRSKLKGYKEALEKFGIQYDASLIKECDFDNDTTMNMLDEILQMDNPPTAIIASDDIGAVITINKLLSKGLKLPEDFAVVGGGDFKLNSMSYLPLTTYRFPTEKIGAKAVCLLYKMSNGLPCKKIVWEKGELIIRKSCGFHWNN